MCIAKGHDMHIMYAPFFIYENTDKQNLLYANLSMTKECTSINA